MMHKRKRFWIILFIFVVFVTSATADTLFVSTPNGKSVNMRSGAGKNNSVVTTIPNGYPVSTDDKLTEGGWLQCDYGDHGGYIDGKFLSAEPVPINGFAVDCYAATVKPTRTGGHVNLREQPTKTSPSICAYTEGEELFVLRTNDTWSQVYDPNSCDYGFIPSSFLVAGDSMDVADLMACLVESAAYIPLPASNTAKPSKDDGVVYSYDEYGAYIPAHPTYDDEGGVYSYDEYGAYMPAHPTYDDEGGVYSYDEYGAYMPAHPTDETSEIEPYPAD